MQRTAQAFERLHWDDVRMFLALYRSRTLALAGKALTVDASTMSRRLAILEDALGARLFDRSRDGIAPTEAAEQLLSVAEEIEQGVARFASLVDRLDHQARGLVRVTCPPDVAEVVMVPLLDELLSKYPGLRISLDPGESVLDLTRREADLALRTVRPQGGDLVMTRLTSARWVLVGSPSLCRRVGKLKRFSDVPWVGWSEEFARLAAVRWLAKHGRGIEPVVRSSSLRLQLAAVAAGVGVALVPEPSIEHYRLAKVALSSSLLAAARDWPEDELYLVTHRALRDVPRVRVVWDLLLAKWGERS
jgi:DNA-binding transcriptional LysR family regulator